jgi:hypothetical protein
MFLFLLICFSFSLYFSASLIPILHCLSFSLFCGSLFNFLSLSFDSFRFVSHSLSSTLFLCSHSLVIFHILSISLSLSLSISLFSLILISLSLSFLFLFISFLLVYLSLPLSLLSYPHYLKTH